MKIATVDLDDTLIPTQVHYIEAKNRLADFLYEEFGIDKERTNECRDEISHSQLDKMGVSLERMPFSFELTCRELVDDEAITEDLIQKVREMGEYPFMEEEEFAEEGFLPDAEEMLSVISDHADVTVILTAGVPRLQNKKIRALNLQQFIDDVRVVEHHGKAAALRELCSEYDVSPEEVTHIGNSRASDVEAAIEVGANAVYIPRGEWQRTADKDYSSHELVSTFSSQREYINHIVAEDKFVKTQPA